MNTTLIKYIRKNNTPIACLVAIKTNEEVRIGFSKYSNKEEKAFNKETAKKLALSRARNSHLYTIHKEWNYKRNAFSYTPVANFPESLSGEMKIFVDRVRKYFRVDEIDNAYVEKEHEKIFSGGPWTGVDIVNYKKFIFSLKSDGDFSWSGKMG